MINQAGGSRRLGFGASACCRAACPVRYFEFVPQWADISAQPPRPHPERARSARRARGPANAGAPRRRERRPRGRDPPGDGLLGPRYRRPGGSERVGAACERPACRRSTASASSSSATSWPGPTPGLVLADLGADVLKVEDPSHPDDARSMGPHFQGDQSLYFVALNSGKRSIGVRLATDEGRAGGRGSRAQRRRRDRQLPARRAGEVRAGPRRVARGEPGGRHVLPDRLRRDRPRRAAAPDTTTRSRRWPAS